MEENNILSVDIRNKIDAAAGLHEVMPSKRGPILFRCIQKEILFETKDELYRKIEDALKKEERVQIRKTINGTRYYRIKRIEVK